MRWLACLLPIAAAVLLPERAAACSCESGGEATLTPAEGATELPTNTLVWLPLADYFVSAQGEPDAFLVEDGTRAIVRVTASSYSGDAAYVVLRPDRLLEPRTRYEVFLEIEPPPGSTLEGTFGFGPNFSFRTADGPDEEAPPAPSVQLIRVDSHAPIPLIGDSCGNDGSYFAFFRVQHEGLLAFAELDGRLAPAPTSTGDSEFWLGSGACMNNWAEAGPGAATEIRFAAVDLAGNVSPWSEAQLVVLPGCSCSTGSPAAALPLLLVALALCRSPRPGGQLFRRLPRARRNASPRGESS